MDLKQFVPLKPASAFRINPSFYFLNFAFKSFEKLLLVPAIFPSDPIGDGICEKAQNWSDDKQKNTSDNPGIVPRKHDDDRADHVVDTIPWLEHRAGFIPKAPLEKALYYISSQCSNCEQCSEKYSVSESTVEVVVITKCRQDFHKNAPQKHQQNTHHYASEYTCDDPADGFVFPEQFCLYRARKLSDVEDIFCYNRHSIGDESRQKYEENLSKISEMHRQA